MKGRPYEEKADIKRTNESTILVFIWPIHYFDAASILSRIATIVTSRNDNDSDFAKSVVYGLYANCVCRKYAVERGYYASD